MEDNKKISKFYSQPGDELELWWARKEAVLEEQGVLDVVAVDVMGTISEDGQLNDAVKLQVAKSRARGIQV